MADLHDDDPVTVAQQQIEDHIADAGGRMGAVHLARYQQLLDAWLAAVDARDKRDANPEPPRLAA